MVFVYRFSPLIYSEHFGGLPTEVRSYIYQRLYEVLTGLERGAEFAAVSDAERDTILAILGDTLPDFSQTEARKLQ